MQLYSNLLIFYITYLKIMYCALGDNEGDKIDTPVAMFSCCGGIS